MTKADLVEKVTRLGDLTRRDGEVIVETVFESVISALQSGDKIEIRGFAATPRPESALKSPPSASPTSNPQRNCATSSTPAKPQPLPRNSNTIVFNLLRATRFPGQRAAKALPTPQASSHSSASIKTAAQTAAAFPCPQRFRNSDHSACDAGKKVTSGLATTHSESESTSYFELETCVSMQSEST
jgi:hypothetical protein